MNEVLDPLIRIPGVRFAALISSDGVPVALLEGKGTSGQDTDFIAAAGDQEAFAGLCAGWLTELKHIVAPLSWDSPRRVVMRASRGAIVIHEGPGAILLVVLEHGAVPEELRVPMEGAATRMQRLLRQLGQAPAARLRASDNTHPGSAEAPNGIFPNSGGSVTGLTPSEIEPNPITEGSGENS